MNRMIVLAVVLGFIVSASAANSQMVPAGSQQQGAVRVNNDTGSPIKITILTGGGLFGPAKDRYKVGDQVPVTITMTNTSMQPIYVCDSDTLYQDLPELIKDGRTLPYLNGQAVQLADSRKNDTCQNENLPEPRMLKPNEPAVVDWFILADGTDSTGASPWYDSLPEGKYELTIQRRFNCCDGPMVESNKISFEIVR